MEDANTVLYDLSTDPGQTTPIDAATVKRRRKDSLFHMMAENDAPPEAVARTEPRLRESCLRAPGRAHLF